jgi:hypothetical protein
MAAGSRRNGACRWRDAITSFSLRNEKGLDQPTRDLLDRLVKNFDAAAAFDRLQLDNRQGSKLLLACIEADSLARNFPQLIAKEKAMLNRLQTLDQNVAELREFVREQTKQPINPLSARIWYSEPDLSAMKQGLYLISNMISARRRIAMETPGRLGSTRKSQIKQAKIIAAIGWLAEGVHRITGKRNLRVVADLAQVIVKKTVDEEAVRRAIKNRREWRFP